MEKGNFHLYAAYGNQKWIFVFLCHKMINPVNNICCFSKRTHPWVIKYSEHVTCIKICKLLIKNT